MIFRRRKIIILSFHNSGFGYEKEDSDYEDYDDSEPSPVGRVGAAVVMATPQFTTQPLSLLVNEGEVIR